MFRKKGGGGLLSVFENSLARLLASAYPEHIWEASKFNMYVFSSLSENLKIARIPNSKHRWNGEKEVH